MKINIWIHKDQAISGKIKTYSFHCPQPGYQNYIQVSITHDEFVKLEDNKTKYKENDWDGDHWVVNQYNRNREISDQVKSKQDIPRTYTQENSGKKASVGLGEKFYASERELSQLEKEMKQKTGIEFMQWFHKLTKNEQTKLAAYYND
tara:strand:- start:1370 stop:1813 length:444 start_codon:yes stop_codon:yes gene_type:complete